MALIKCPECGKEISDKAGACPHCGCPIGNFWDMMAELVKPEDLQILKERAEAIVEGGADK